MSWYLKSTKHTGLKFKIMHFDKEAKKAKIQGDTGVPFEISMTKDNLEKYGYEVVKVVEDEAPA